MISLPEQIHITNDGSFLAVCNRVCTSLKPSGSREQDEELIFETLCQIFADRSHKNVSFTPYPDSSKIDNLKEHLFLLIDNQEESDRVVEYVYEFLDNVYPQEELWRLKM
ncbi:MAG: hypothetical protein M3033_01020 [Acidobacteriota bacterium]|nr:hypothetical protein [Acidobacteriota bacterium]